MIRPMKVASRIAATTRPEWTAHHRIPSSAITMAAATRCQSCASDANSSSASGTGPVRRMRTPWASSRPSERAAARIALLAASPGCKALKSITGWTMRTRRVWRRTSDDPHDVLPGEEGGLARRRLVERIGERHQQRLELVELRLAVLDALQEARHGGQHAAQRRIRRQRRQQGLRARQAFDSRLNLRQREKQQAVAIEERPAVGTPDDLEQPGFARQGGRQAARRVLGQLRRRAVDHHDRQPLQRRERALIGQLALTPLVPGRDQLRGVGGHGEMTGGIDQRRRRQAEGEKQHDEWMSRSGRDDAAKP